MELPFSNLGAQHFFAIKGRLIVIDSDIVAGRSCNSHHNILIRTKGDEFIAGIAMHISKEERRCACFDEIVGLFGVESLEPPQDEIIFFDYF